MKTLTLLAVTLLVYVAPCLAAPGGDFVIKKVDVDYPPSPDFGNQPGIRWTPQKWGRMDVTFDAVPDFTEELTFNYYVLYDDHASPSRLFVGRVNHVNIAKGAGLHSVMYISPKTIQRLTQRKPVNFTSLPLTQVTVTITKPGVAAPLAVGNFKAGGHGEWWTTMKQEEGFLVNKSETPFAPVCWDYYEAVKPASAH
ncbi:MAG: Amuc_1102 family pilus-like protein [Verrucomicrobiota bacterium]